MENRKTMIGLTPLVDEVRDSYWMLRRYMKDLGLQIINTVLGGTLYQDLPTQHPSDIVHRMKPPYDQTAHEVNLMEDSPLRQLLGKERTGMNSCHHQAIMDLAPMAWSPDGLIEAAYKPEGSFLWAFQWHPEFSYKVNPDSAKIFNAFVTSIKD